MKVKRINGLIIYWVFISSLTVAGEARSEADLIPEFLPNLPPWEIEEAPPKKITVNPPVFLKIDADGNVYRQKLTRDSSGTYDLTKEVISDATLAELDSVRTIVFIEDEELPKGKKKGKGNPQDDVLSEVCTIPPTFSLIGDSSGESQVFFESEFTSKPVDATTQWIQFDFWTEDFRGRGNHAVLPLFWTEVLHGWGALLGDNHRSSDGCGSSSRFNSQVEGFLSLPPKPPVTPAPTWQNAVFSSTCGNEMYDGRYTIAPGFTVPRYRMEMQSSTGHWVAYRIFEYGVNGWEIITDWQSTDTDTGPWPFPPPMWVPDTEGIYIGATDAEHPGAWSFNFTDVRCGWF